ncbi:LPP20 family lipoprotein [Reichenbachiella carrageenanivorans]|uniref:LPP20 family lipoprotein n=1 Tax=Reichenbachiella carrageenanivorans TaxID=2979869 RepID=A0ABY6CXS5_9BACT|nr:LPP20 family lipoprotein [Reichenbachiella carrageenanivorans]UXX78715.1 LPP20 family lipoprotein [Reichenbachiella carrageenanivorans]
MRFIVPVLFLFILGTPSFSQAGKPKWVKNRPVSDTYYIGIARVATSTPDFNQIAKNKALADIISDISVELSSTSVFHQLEENNVLKDTYESWTQTKIKDELEGYELVDSYTKKGYYWVYYRLDIANYKKIKQDKLDKAKKLSTTLLEKAIEEQEKGEIGNALQIYKQAFDAIVPHLNEDLSAFVHEHGRIDLANHIHQSVVSIFANLSFRTTENPLVFKPLSDGETPYFVARYKDQPAKDLSLLIGKYGESQELYQPAKSNDKGVVLLPIVNIQANSTQSIEVALDLDKSLGKKSTENILRAMFSQKRDAPSDRINVKVEAQTAIFSLSENQNRVIKSTQSILTTHLFNKVADESTAQFIVHIDGHWHESKYDERYDLYRETLNYSIRIIHQPTQAVIYHTTNSDIKGVKSGSQNKAKEEALSALDTQLRYEIIPEINLIKID